MNIVVMHFFAAVTQERTNRFFRGLEKKGKYISTLISISLHECGSLSNDWKVLDQHFKE